MSRLENNSIGFRDELIARNLYKPSDIYDIENPKISQALNSISRLLRPGNAFDFSNTVIGRVIGPQTPITEIGRKALINLYTEQVKSTIIRKKAPIINFDNLLRKPNEIVKFNIDYSITKQEEKNIENLIFTALRYSGVNRLSNPLKIEPVIDNRNYNTDELSKYYLKNTGKGQRNILINHLSSNIFSNNLNDIFEVDNTAYKTFLISKKSDISFLSKSFNIDLNTDLLGFSIASEIYSRHFEIRYNNIFYVRTNQNGQMNLNKNVIEEDFGSNYFINKRFKDIDIFNNNDIVTLNKSNRIFTWGVDQPSVITNSKGILGYTAALFNILNAKGNAPFNKTVGSIEINGEKYYNGIRYGKTDGNGNVIQNRTYDLTNQMDRVSKTIKPYGYDQKIRINSPIYERPIPKVVLDEVMSGPVKNNVMFTIENLAIDATNVTEIIEKNERGPNGGRILWFAPMIENFNESVTPTVNTTNFLGRGEPVYTYANTERKLTINFMMVVDHVDELVGLNTSNFNFNSFQERLYNIVRRGRIDGKREVEDTKTNENIKNLSNQIKEITKISIPFVYDEYTEISYYFENNIRDMQVNINSGYEEDGLNSSFINQLNLLLLKLSDYYNQNNNARFTITLKGFASAFFLDRKRAVEYNKQLSLDRAKSLENFIKDYIRTTMTTQNEKLLDIIDFIIEPLGDSEAEGRTEFFQTNLESINSDIAKRDRKASILSVNTVTGTEEIDIPENLRNVDTNIVADLENEKDNTEKVLDDNIRTNNERINFVVRDDIKDADDRDMDTTSTILNYRYQNGLTVYTPYELYKRLTFLHQCTRQGRTIEPEGTSSNAVFGRPPIIVFRLGDMYNTRAIITSLNIDFENNLPWDINPEGFGVQKMGCRVSLSMNLIGGSSHEKPKNHILNAESRRFYANSRFEANADDKLDREE